MDINFMSLQQAIAEAERRSCRLGDLALEYECALSERDAVTILDELRRALHVMRQSRDAGLARQEVSFSGLTGSEAFTMNRTLPLEQSLLGSIGRVALSGALAVSQMNAAMGKVVASPTAGSCGILPGALLAVADARQCDESEVLSAMLTAAAVGLTIALRASIAGASGGCQAECGSASAMAAAALVELLGGTPTHAGHAAALALKSIMGLVCDPVGGLVEIPCIKRNGFGAMQALVAAEMALAGIASAIPVDEVILCMKEVGDNMPSCYKETAQGGLATTPTGILLKQKLYEQHDE